MNDAKIRDTTQQQKKGKPEPSREWHLNSFIPKLLRMLTSGCIIISKKAESFLMNTSRHHHFCCGVGKDANRKYVFVCSFLSGAKSTESSKSSGGIVERPRCHVVVGLPDNNACGGCVFSVQTSLRPRGCRIKNHSSGSDFFIFRPLHREHNPKSCPDVISR